MDASRIFNELLNQIERSKLNYVINKTPFTANISIKKSFIKWFDPSIVQDEEKEATFSNRDSGKEKLATTHEENNRLEEFLKKERLDVKRLESDIEKLRNEVLDVKKDRNTTCKKFECQNEEMIAIKQHSSEMQMALNDTKNELSKKRKDKKGFFDVKLQPLL